MHKWIEAYKVDNNYYRLRVRSVSPLLNTKLGDWDFENKHHISIIRIKRRHPNRLKGNEPFIEFPENSTELLYHDIITIKGETEAINAISYLITEFTKQIKKTKQIDYAMTTKQIKCRSQPSDN